MPDLFRTRSGQRVFDDFDGALDPAWRIEPASEAGRVTTTERPGHLRLKAGATRLFVVRDLPADPNLVVEAEVDYEPTAATDLGGLVLYGAAPDEWAGIVEQVDPLQPPGWRHLRLVRTGTVQWDAYASHDREAWDWLGTMRFPEAAAFGFVLDETTGNPLDVDVVRAFVSTRITVGGVEPGQTVRLLADDATTVLAEAVVPAGADRVGLDVGALAFPVAGYVRVYAADGTVLRDSDLLTDVWGGDEYAVAAMVAVYDEAGNRVPLDQEWDFGDLPGGARQRRLELRNDTDLDMIDVTVAVIPHPASEFGASWVDIAPDVNGAPGQYGEEAAIGAIPSGTSAYVWVRVTRGADGPQEDRYRFGLRITVS